MAMNWDLSIFQKQKLQLAARLISLYNSLSWHIFLCIIGNMQHLKGRAAKKQQNVYEGRNKAFPHTITFPEVHQLPTR